MKNFEPADNKAKYNVSFLGGNVQLVQNISVMDFLLIFTRDAGTGICRELEADV